MICYLLQHVEMNINVGQGNYGPKDEVRAYAQDKAILKLIDDLVDELLKSRPNLPEEHLAQFLSGRSKESTPAGASTTGANTNGANSNAYQPPDPEKGLETAIKRFWDHLSSSNAPQAKLTILQNKVTQISQPLLPQTDSPDSSKPVPCPPSHSKPKQTRESSTPSPQKTSEASRDTERPQSAQNGSSVSEKVPEVKPPRVWSDDERAAAENGTSSANGEKTSQPEQRDHESEDVGKESTEKNSEVPRESEADSKTDEKNANTSESKQGAERPNIEDDKEVVTENTTDEKASEEEKNAASDEKASEEEAKDAGAEEKAKNTSESQQEAKKPKDSEATKEEGTAGVDEPPLSRNNSQDTMQGRRLSTAVSVVDETEARKEYQSSSATETAPSKFDGSGGASRGERITTTELWSSDYKPRRDVFEVSRNLSTWHTVGKKLWPSYIIDDLSANCRMMTEKHNYGEAWEIVVPLYIYSVTIFRKITWAVWVPYPKETKRNEEADDEEEDDAGEWVRIGGIEGIENIKRENDKRSESEGNELQVDQKTRHTIIKEVNNMGLRSGRSDDSETLTVQWTSEHLVSVFVNGRFLESEGRDSEYLKGWEGLTLFAADNLKIKLARYDISNDVLQNNREYFPILDAILWLPKYGLFNRKNDALLRKIPPPGIIEYASCRSYSEKLTLNSFEKEKDFYMKSEPFSWPTSVKSDVTKLIKQCIGIKNQKVCCFFFFFLLFFYLTVPDLRKH